MFIDNLLKQNNLNIMKENENQQEIRNIPMGRQIPMGQQQFQVQNYQQEEENELAIFITPHVEKAGR